MLRQIQDALHLTLSYPQLRRWYLGNHWRRLMHVRDYHFRRDGTAHPPRAISLRPTFLCNLNCMMCSFANSASTNGDIPITREKDFMSIEVARRLVDDIAPSNVCLSVTGGEPFLWKPVFELFEHARSRGVMTTVTTNGTLIKRRISELTAAPPDVVIVSVLGDRETHDHVVGRMGAFDHVVEGIQMIHEAKKGKRLAEPLIILNTPLLMENADACHEVVKLGEGLPVFVNHFQHLWFVTKDMRDALERTGTAFSGNYTESIAIDTEAIDPEVIWRGMERVRGSSNGVLLRFYPDLSHDEVRTYYREPQKLVKRKRAICAWIFTHVLPNGDVSPCLGLVAGNLQEQSFNDVWNSDAFRRFRCSLRERGTLPICARCCVFFRDT